MLIEIENNGQDIEQTSYWETDLAKKGIFFVSTNAGAVRLLVPPKQKGAIKDIKTGKKVVISKGIMAGQETLEILFEDNSNNPFVIYMGVNYMGVNQVDLVPSDGDAWIFSAWTVNGKVYEAKCSVRTVSSLPSSGIFLEGL